MAQLLPSTIRARQDQRRELRSKLDAVRGEDSSRQRCGMCASAEHLGFAFRGLGCPSKALMTTGSSRPPPRAKQTHARQCRSVSRHAALVHDAEHHLPPRIHTHTHLCCSTGAWFVRTGAGAPAQPPIPSTHTGRPCACRPPASACARASCVPLARLLCASCAPLARCPRAASLSRPCRRYHLFGRSARVCRRRVIAQAGCACRSAAIRARAALCEPSRCPARATCACACASRSLPERVRPHRARIWSRIRATGAL